MSGSQAYYIRCGEGIYFTHISDTFLNVLYLGKISHDKIYVSQ
jgi:hypothetical protein